MAQVLVNESSIEDIADAIRAKNGSSDTYLPSEMGDAIRNIPAGGGGVTGVKGNAESSYRTGNVNLAPADIGAKAVQSAVSNPSASGNAIAFIDSITQNAQGVISPTKKTVRSASTSQSGLMSAADKTKLNGIAEGAQVNAITGVKGDAEETYRTGNVNLTLANIGAAPASVVDDVDTLETIRGRMVRYKTELTYPIWPNDLALVDTGSDIQLWYAREYIANAEEDSNTKWLTVGTVSTIISRYARYVDDLRPRTTTLENRYNDLQTEIDEHYGEETFSPVLESGTINASGVEQARVDRIRTVDYIDLSKYEGSVTIPENHAIMPAYYDANKVWQKNGSWFTECDVSDFETYSYVRFVVRNNQHLSDDISDEIGSITLKLSRKNKSNEKLTDAVGQLQAPVENGGLVQIARLGWEVYSATTPPEQSLASYALAYQNGCRTMLADVQVTSDGEYVCFHDLTLGDDTGTSNPVRHTDGTELTAAEKALHVYDLTLAELDAFDFGIKKGSQYAGTKILRLADFLKWCKVMNCTAMIETKVNLTAAQAGDIADMVLRYGLDRHFIWAENAYTSSWGGITIPVIVQKLPNAVIHIRGGSNNYQNAFAMAEQYATAAKHTQLCFTSEADMTDEVLALLNGKYIDPAFSEIKTLAQLTAMVESGLIYRLSSVACSYVNIGKYFAGKYLG